MGDPGCQAPNGCKAPVSLDLLLELLDLGEIPEEEHLTEQLILVSKE